MGLFVPRLRPPLVAVLVLIASCSDHSSPFAPGDDAKPALGTQESGMAFPALSGATLEVLAKDAFERNETNGWGQADIGGIYIPSTSQRFRVSEGAGTVEVPDRNEEQVVLQGPDARDARGLVRFSIDRGPDGGSHTVQVVSRYRNNDGPHFYGFLVSAYRNKVDARALVSVGGSERWVSGNTRVSSSFVGDAWYWIRWETVGPGETTQVRVRVWRDGEPEPSTWQIDELSSEPALDAGGSVGFRVEAGNQRSWPLRFHFDDLLYQSLAFPDPDPDPVVTSVHVTPSSADLAPGGSVTLAAEARDPDGAPMTGVAFTWSSSDPAVATVNASGVVTAVADGQATVSATAPNGVSGTSSIGVESPPDPDPVGPQPSPGLLLVRDTFSRIVTPGWGTADFGGSYFIRDPTRWSVDGQHGLITFEVGGNANTPIEDAKSYGRDVEGLVRFSISRPPDSGFHTVQVYARRDDTFSDGDNYYRFRVRTYSSQMDIRVEENVDGVSTFIMPNTPVAPTFEPNAWYWIRWEAVGPGEATRIRMKVWRAGEPEPSGWDADLIHNQPALGDPGTVGVRASPASNQSSWPVQYRFDDLHYVELGGSP